MAINLNTSDSSQVNFRCKDWQDQMIDLKLITDLWGGTRALRMNNRTYLPQEPKETTKAYSIRSNKAILYNVFKKTVNGLTGMVFKQDMVSKSEYQGSMQSIVDNIDYTGTNLAIFCRDTFNAAMRDGHSIIYVDYSAFDPKVVSRADEEKAGMRARWVLYTKDQLINWRYKVLRSGEQVLTLAVICEQIKSEDGQYGELITEQYRVLYPGRWEVWQVGPSDSPQAGRLRMVDSGTTSIDFIPLIPVYTNKTGYFKSDPPLLEMAHLNIGHYQVYSDHRHILHVANVPILWFIGRQKDKNGNVQEIGANAGVDLENGGSMGFAEHHGYAIESNRNELKDLEDRMVVMGLDLSLPKGSKISVTATETVIGRSTQTSILSDMAKNAKNCFNMAFKTTDAYYGETTDNQANLMTNFDKLTLDPQSVQVYLQMKQQGMIDFDTLWDILQGADWIPSSADPKVVKANIKAEAPLPPVLPAQPPPGNPETGPGQIGGRVS